MGFIELNVLNSSAASRGPALGIDLGTTNSLAAEWRDGRGVVLHPEGQSGIVPSALYFPEGGEPIVGAEARALAREDPLHALFSIKRFMGRGLRDVAGELDSVPCPVRETAYGVIQFEMRGRLYTPQELSALILRRVLTIAGRHQKGDRVRAVITVPAYFDDTQRQATRDAARLAEIDVLRIVNEPTAASLAYGLDQKGEGTVAVYDLGGGTFDVSILAIEDGVFRVLATAGDTHLGGDDLDRALGERALERFGDAIDPETRSDPAFRLALRLAAERCKIALSRDPTADLVLSLPSSGVQCRGHIERADFETWIAPMIQRTLASCAQALADAAVSPGQIEEVVLVGGSTRIPAVRRAVEAFFGRKPHTELNPDEVVALGAAAQAHVLSGGTRDFLLMDVTPLSLGIETIGGATSKIIQRNSTIPCEATESFTTYADNQTGIDFNIVQGERELAADCRSLGRFKLSGIPPMPAGMARVRVRFHIDADGLLTVSAVEEKSGQSAHIEVQPLNGLTDEEVERMLRESFENARSDFDNRRVADLHVELGTMIAATHKGLESAGAQLDQETREDIRSALERAEKATSSRELEAVQQARDELERATLSLAALLMDNVARAALAGKTLNEV